MFKLVTKTYEAHGYSAREAQVTGRALAQIRRETVKVVAMTSAEVEAWQAELSWAPTVEDLEEVPAQGLPAWWEGETLADLVAQRDELIEMEDEDNRRWCAEYALGEEIARILAERQIHAFT